MAGTIQIELTGIGVSGENYDITGSGEIETFASVRNTNKKVTIAASSGAVSAQIAQQVKFLYDAYFTDYNDKGQYTMSYDADSVYITHVDNDHFDSRTGTATNVTVTKTTTTQRPTVTVVESYGANDPATCNSLEMTLTFTVSGAGTVEGLEILRFFNNTDDGSEVTLYNNASHNSNTLVLSVSRHTHFATTANVTIGSDEYSFSLTVPQKSNLVTDVQVQQSTFSSSVFIYGSEFIGSDENEFAIGITNANLEYQSSNVFSGITEGDYYAFIKDKYGCVAAQAFTVDEGGNFVINKKMFISIKNSLYFASRKVVGLVANVTNFLSYDDPYPVLNDTFTQVYAESQIAENQFKSGYPKHEATLQVICETGGLTRALDIEKKTDNISRNTFLDGKVVKFATTDQAVIFFENGNEYDENDVVIGTHTYNGTLPAFYVPGTEIRIDGFNGVILYTYEESSITYAVTNILGLGLTLTPVDKIVESVHFALDHEVYQFDVDHSNTLVGSTYQVTVKAFDNVNNDVESEEYLSERVKVITDAEFTEGNYHVFEFWSNDSDAEIDYTDWRSADGTGETPQTSTTPNYIKQLRNLQFELPLSPVSNAEIETEKLGTSPVKIDAQTIDAFKVSLAWMPSLFARSVAKLFDESEFVAIDGVVYTSLSAAEMTGGFQNRSLNVIVGKIGTVNELDIERVSLSSFYPVYP